jgi:hypothetical protein
MQLWAAVTVGVLSVVFFGAQSVGGYPLIGTNGGAGWGPAPAATLLQAGIAWDRIAYDYPSNGPEQYSVSTSAGYGFQALLILGNTDDNTLLSTFSPSDYGSKCVQVIQQFKNQISLYEIGNEMFLKGGKADPVSYANLVMALYDAYDAAGLSGHRLLINAYGDYQLANGQWSSLDSTPIAGWLGVMAKTQPRLLARCVRALPCDGPMLTAVG